MKFAILILAIALTSCVKHVEPKPADNVIVREGYAIREISPDVFVVYVQNGQTERYAQIEICADDKYICFGPTQLGRFFTIERRKK